MEFGNIILWSSGLTLAASLVSYWRGQSNPSALAAGHRWYYAMTGLLTLATGYLLYLFLAGHYEYTYVTGYSAESQELFYKISALWAGQEGTFLLWAWMAAVLGLFVIRHGGPLAARTMFYFLFTMLFLLALMYVRSPFATVPEANVPLDGRGLNPLLKDPWMVIHPPIVFLGYAAFTFPFCYALAGLAKRNWQAFATAALPWGGFAVATLGAGIFIGGFWAYKVLGWGGYWGWDPVENASLIPWLTGLAMLHGFILLKGSGKLLKTAIGLSVVSYVLVIYGTFLTRSGVLAEFSVHSFTDLGLNGYLIGFLVLITIYSIIRMIQCTRDETPPPISTAVTSREFGIVMGIVLLSLTAALIWLGTSSPIFTTIAGNPANVSMSYYNTIAQPVGIFIALILGFSPFLLYERMPWKELFKSVFPSLIVAVIGTAGVYLVQSLEVTHAILVFAALLAIGSNLSAMIRFSQGKLLRIAGHLTHFGFGIMVLGIVGSSAYATAEKLSLPTGATESAFGYDITFNGKIDNPNNAEEGFLDLTIQTGTTVINARPRLYVAEYNQQEMRKPYVRYGFLSDLYIAPLEHRKLAPTNTIAITKGEQTDYNDWTIAFLSFDLGSHEGSGAMQVGAVLTATRGADTISFMPILESGAAGQKPIPIEMPGTGIVFSLIKMSVEQKAIQLQIDDPSGPGNAGPDAVLFVEVSQKPVTSFVWIGTILITVGSCLSFWRRRREMELLS